MAEETLDKLIFALDGDLTALKQRYAEAEQASQKTGTNIQANIGKAFKGAANDAGTHLNLIKKGLNESADAAEKLGTHVEISRREMIYAGRELVNGDFQRLPATLALLLSHFLEIPAATLAAGAAIGAIPVGLVIAVEKADASLAKLRTAIALTGKASGLSLDMAVGVAADVSREVPISPLSSRDIVGGLIGAQVPGQNINQAAVAGTNYMIATDAKSDAVTAMMKKMFDDPSASAQELNASMNLLTGAQTREVEDLQRAGQYEKAAQIELDAFTQRTKEAADSASFLTKMLDRISLGWGQIATDLPHFFGFGLSDAQKYQNLTQSRAGAEYLFQHGEKDQAPIIARLDKEIADLAPKVAAHAAEGINKGTDHTLDQSVTRGIDAANKGANSFGDTLYNLKLAVTAANGAVTDAQRLASRGDEDVKKRIPILQAEAKAAADAVNYFKTPDQIKQQEANDAVYVASLPQQDQAKARELLAAKRTHERELANPQTNPYADADYEAAKKQSSVADIALQNRQRTALALLQAEAEGESKVADAYAKGSAAVIRAKIEEEAAQMVTREHGGDIRAITKALEEKAIATERAAVAEHIYNTELANQGLAREVAANGSPSGILAAKRVTEATGVTDKEIAGAQARVESSADNLNAAQAAYATFGGKANAEKLAQAAQDYIQASQELASAGKDYSKVLRDLSDRDRQAELAQFKGEVYSTTQSIDQQRMRGQLMGSGMTPDDERHFDVATKSFDDLVHKGMDPATKAFWDQYNIINPLNEKLSDFTDEIDRARQAAKEYANDVTGGIKSWIMGGGKGGIMGLGDAIGQNMLSTSLDQALKPVNDELTKQFGSILGVPDNVKADGSIASPYHVLVDGGLEGIGSGSGGLGTGSGGIFGDGSDIGGLIGHSAGTGVGEAEGGGDFIGTASDSGSGIMGWLSSAFDWLADGGPANPGQPYIVGEEGPELFKPDVAGTVIPNDKLGPQFGGGKADGGQLDPSKYYVVGENGPEIWGPGRAGMITPMTQTQQGGSVGGGSNPRQSTGGNINLGGIHFHGQGHDVPNILRSRGQIESVITGAAMRGQRQQ